MTKLHSSNLAKMAGTENDGALLELREKYRSTVFVRFVIRPFLQTVLILSLIVGLLALIRAVTLDDRWFSLLPLFFFVILEAIYTTNWIKHPDRLRLDRSTYRAAELLLLLIITRLATWVVFDGGLPLREQLVLYFTNPFSFILNGPFLVAVVLTMIAWRLAILIGDIFMQLQVSEFELRFYSLPLALRKARSDDQPIYTSRRQLVTRFAQFWLWGGVLLVITIGLSTLELSSLTTLKNPLAIARFGLQPGLLAVLLIYFGAGFFLLSQAKLMEMNSRWLLNEFEQDELMQKRWQRSSLFLLLLIGLIAAFLPIGPNLAIGYIIAALLYALFLLGSLIIFLLTLPLLLLYALFPGQTGEQAPPLPPIAPENIPDEVPPELSSLGETIALVLTSAFWTVLAVIAVLALLYFLRERKQILQERSIKDVWSRFWRGFKNYLFNLWHRIENVNLKLPDFSSGKKEQEPGESSRNRPWGFFRLGALNPRQQIRYFYLSTVRRAGERGVKRGVAETPLEFAEDLKDGWPTAKEGVEVLTNAFLKARYTTEPISDDDLPQVKKTWKDVRRQLKKRSERGGQEAADQSGQ